ncbi:MAG: cell division protein FtsL [Tissierellia bacterium]|nr:cell division protein FtsL [Tissierellia bacterium]
MLAREFSYYPEETFEVQEKQRKKVVRKKKNNSVLKLFLLTIPFIILSISLLILSGYAKITTIRQELTELEREKVELEKTKMNLIADLEGIKSSGKIEEDAITKLGMDYPNEDQIVYITVNVNEDPIEQEEKLTLGGRLGKILGIVSNLF